MLVSRGLYGLGVIVAVLAVLGCDDGRGTPDRSAQARPASATDLLGRWFPADGRAQGRAYAEFASSGEWVGSDGCNGQRGTWHVERPGTFRGTAGPSTKIACENVPLALWIAGATRSEIEGATLVLRDAHGAEIGRLVRHLR